MPVPKLTLPIMVPLIPKELGWEEPKLLTTLRSPYFSFFFFAGGGGALNFPGLSLAFPKPIFLSPGPSIDFTQIGTARFSRRTFLGV